MKRSIYIIVIAAVALTACKKLIDQYPQSNLNTGSYYATTDEVRAGLTAAYKGLQAPMLTEWMMTEVRSDNSKQGVTGSSSTPNRELNELDMFTLNSTHPKVYDYWQNTYSNIRNANIILQKLGVTHDAVTGTTSFAAITLPIADADRKQFAGEALFIRAYHYFNLVRLYGGVFLIHKPISPTEALATNRSTESDIYKFIQADLKLATESMNTQTFSQQSAADRGRVTIWAAKTLLAKIYLTQNKKAEAITLLTDIKDNSGHSLVTSAGSAGNAYANVFSASNEVNAEIIFAIRYKALSGSLGSPFANRFAPLQSGTAIVPGDGQGLNYPTADLDSLTRLPDARKTINLARYVSGANTKVYPRKFLPNPNPSVNPQAMTSNDAETDWPVLRYADVLLMLAEAQGNSASSITMINQVRTRSGAPAINAAGITSVELFEDTLSTERRIEFAFENHRWFDLLRYNITMTTVSAVSEMQEHFENEYMVHYNDYPAPKLTLAELKSLVAVPGRLLLPIPQREIDTNTKLAISQNLSY